MADENVIIEENEQNVGEYDPNPYDNVTVEEALKQLFNRFTPRTVRQAIFTMAENNKPATLIEKSITENGEYNASADNADGYSSVTVNVPEFSKVRTITTKTVYGGTEVADNLFILRSSTGHYNITDVTGDGGIWILLDPVIEITGYSTVSSSPTFIFTPHEDLESFTSLTFTGDEIVPGDGKTYKAVIDYGSRNYVMTKFDTDFVGVIG